MKTIIVSAFLILKLFFGQNSCAMGKDSYPIDGGLADKFKYLVTQYQKGEYKGNEFEELKFYIPINQPEVLSKALTLSGNNTYSKSTAISRNLIVEPPLGFCDTVPSAIINLEELYKLFLKIETDQLFQKNVTDAKQRAGSMHLEEYARDFLTNLKLLQRMEICVPIYKILNINVSNQEKSSPEFDTLRYMARLASKKNYKCIEPLPSEYVCGTILFESQLNEQKQVITIDMMFETILEQADYLKTQEYKENNFLNFYKTLSKHLEQVYVLTTKKGFREYLEYLISKGVTKKSILDVMEELS